MAKKITLVKPEVRHPVKIQGKGGDVGIPLNLLYLGAYLRDNSDIEIDIKDYRLNKALGLERKLEQDFSASDIIGVGACTSESPDAIEILRKAKEMGKTTIMGGLYATFNSEKILLNNDIDFIVRGEGEITQHNLIKAINGEMPIEEVKGISYKKDGEIIHNQDAPLIRNLDELPLPAYELIDPEIYAKFGPAPIYSARGCPMTCDFCTVNKMWGYQYRTRSPENIIEELEMLKSFGFNRVHFKDESVTLNKKSAMALFEEIEKANLGLSYKAKSRINQIDSELLEQMMRAGLDTIHTGVESISQNTLDRMSKGVKKDSIKKTFDLMSNYSCNLNPVYLVGSSGETAEELAENANFIREMGSSPNVITYISFMTPHPGTGLDRDDGLYILTKDYSRYTHKQPVSVPKSLGKNGLQKIVDTYHSVVEDIGMEHVNPRINSEYIDQISQEYRREVEVA